MRRAVLGSFVLVLVACSSGTPTANPTAGSTSSTTGAPITGNWPVYHHDSSRSGVSSDQRALGNVRQSWTSARLDELVYAQPLVVGNRVIVATEGNTVYSLDARTGTIVW